jgi:hypothetical protein|tara:strand:+ start:6420 stop:6710 length:291 start_codon:yes stop_codon:yes gene_type:complete
MKNFTQHLSKIYSDEESNIIFGKLDADLEERTFGMLSLWDSFEHKAPINNKAGVNFAKKFIKKEKLKIHEVVIRGRQIGFKDARPYYKYLLKVKNV